MKFQFFLNWMVYLLLVCQITSEMALHFQMIDDYSIIFEHNEAENSDLETEIEKTEKDLQVKHFNYLASMHYSNSLFITAYTDNFKFSHNMEVESPPPEFV